MEDGMVVFNGTIRGYAIPAVVLSLFAGAVTTAGQIAPPQDHLPNFDKCD